MTFLARTRPARSGGVASSGSATVATTARTISMTRVDDRRSTKASDVGEQRVDVAADDRDVAVRSRPSIDSSSHARSMSRSMRASVRLFAARPRGRTSKTVAEDVDRLQHAADRGAERAVAQQLLDELLAADRDGLRR